MMENSQGFVQHITAKSENFSQWYLDVILRAELADYAPVRLSLIHIYCVHFAVHQLSPIAKRSLK